MNYSGLYDLGLHTESADFMTFKNRLCKQGPFSGGISGGRQRACPLEVWMGVNFSMKSAGVPTQFGRGILSLRILTGSEGSMKWRHSLSVRELGKMWVPCGAGIKRTGRRSLLWAKKFGFLEQITEHSLFLHSWSFCRQQIFLCWRTALAPSLVLISELWLFVPPAELSNA